MDLLDEIQEDLRSEQFRKFWQRYGKMVIGAVVALVLVVAATSGYKQYRQYQSAQNASEFSAAIDLAEDQKRDEALHRLASLSEGAGPGYKTLALFSAASLKYKSGDKTGAIASYDALADASSIDLLYRDLATIFSVSIQLDQPEANYAAIDKRLQPLTGAGRAWRFSALELQGLSAMQKGEKKTAKDIFARLISDPNTPEAMKSRAQRMTDVLTN